MALLEAEGVAKRYRNTVALAGIDIAVGSGELVGLLGPNGAGKSTFVKIACGLTHPTSGAVRVQGHVAGTLEARRSIGYLAELFRFPQWLTAEEVLELHQELTGSTGGKQERHDLLERVGLGDAVSNRVETMSKGMQQRLGIAQALVGSPKLLLLDEPTSALDPGGRRIVRELLSDLREQGTGVLLNSHLLSEIELVCDRVVILLGGEVIAEGSPMEMAGGKGVEIETGEGMKSFPEIARDEVPALVARLIAEGQTIYAVRPLKATLEDVYLEAVQGEVG